MEKEYFFKKRFHPFKRHLNQNWLAENMLVVAGRFVTITTFKLVCSLLTFHKLERVCRFTSF